MVLIHGVLLHGRLNLHLHSARDLWLPAERNLREKLYKNLMSGTSLNPYATVSLEHLPKPSKRILKTKPIAHTTEPVWDHTQTIDVATNVSYLVIHVKSAPYSTQPRPRASLGFVRIKAEHVLLGVDGHYPLVGLHGIAENSKNRGTIRLSIRYLPIDSMPLLGQPSVPGTYFSACDACHVQLFQDAHCPEGAVIPIPGSSDNLYKEAKTRYTNYFETIYYSLMNAKKLIYISGWSVDTTLNLLRRHPAADPSLPLGELLKMKAAQGVVVLLMVWDEVFSTSNPILRLKGIMDTRDEVTRAFFRNSGVKAAVVPRLGRLSEKVFQAPLVPCLFTFHEKLVITDVPTANGKRELTAFCGGLDLTYGRWDTPAHAPFSTLDNVHAADFHNACFEVELPFGPREPWHDIAAMLTGPVVRDFVRCFEERWKRQGLGAGFLADLDSMNDVVDGRFEHEERWTVQVFRSIDERSAVFDKEWARKLETKKGRSVDRSIHHAYVHYTRAANRFIYIEQQYFLGSSNQWLADGHKDGTNLIPNEIALKIVRGIMEGNYLRVYVLIPMYPEGIASDGVTQKILHFQMRTVEMIMKKIAEAIKEVGLDAHPTDFLSLFCLGNREAESSDSSSDSYSFTSSDDGSFKEPPRIPLRRRSSGSDHARQPSSTARSSRSLSSRFSSFRRKGPRTADEELLQVTRRHPIYQHAKMFIADDEVVLTGSANLNERSMCGVRDTELAFSAFQPTHRFRMPADGGRLPRGEVGRFRRRLWAEHVLGQSATDFPEVLEDPGTLECMKEIQRVAMRNWKDYMRKDARNMKSHLLPYPYDVGQDGSVSALVPEFPDTRGAVLGTMSGVIPNILVS